MAPTTKQSLKPTPATSTTSSSGLAKPAPATSTTSSSGLAQRSTTCQYPALVDTTNTTKQIDSVSNNSGKTDQYYFYDFQY